MISMLHVIKGSIWPLIDLINLGTLQNIRKQFKRAHEEQVIVFNTSSFFSTVDFF